MGAKPSTHLVVCWKESRMLVGQFLNLLGRRESVYRSNVDISSRTVLPVLLFTYYNYKNIWNIHRSSATLLLVGGDKMPLLSLAFFLATSS
jgi:hypothetical protein